MANDLSQLDKGTVYQSSKIWLGPSLGWVQEVVRPAATYTTSPITIGPKDSIVLVNVAGPATVNLPDVVTWMKEPAYNPYTPFERALWIKDMSGSAATNPITINAFGASVVGAMFAPGGAQYYGNPLTFMTSFVSMPKFAPILAQSIDGMGSATISTNFGILRLYPSNRLTGWYVG
jgi:hypothetical protein